jgi:filamentous hemagglutinin
LQSGADTSTKGGIVSVPQVTVAAGGTLDINSLHDSSTYNSREKQLSGSVTIGTAHAQASSRSAALLPSIDPSIPSTFIMNRTD